MTGPRSPAPPGTGLLPLIHPYLCSVYGSVMRILIIEDDRETADYLRKGLAENGHVVDHAPTGPQGLAMALESVYDALIVDRMLPGLDGLEVRVVEMEGYQRDMLWEATGLPWVPPSPNLPRFEGALVYPGQVLLEGTNISEARGTTTPFEQFGAPCLHPRQLREALPSIEGAVLRTVSFEPTFQKWAGKPCHGLFVHVTDARTFRSYQFTLLLLRELRRLWPTQFAWNDPPYEYEATLMPIDILTGSTAVREWVDGDGSDARLRELSREPLHWWSSVQASLLY